MSVETVMSSNHLILCCLLLLLPSIFPSIFYNGSFPRVFSNESVLHIRWPKYWSFSFSISSSNEYSGLVSFCIDCLIPLLSKGFSRVFTSTRVRKHEFFSGHPSLWSNSHIHTWLLEKPVLTRWTFVGKVMSLLLNILSRLVITFLPRSKCLLLTAMKSWLQSPSAMILETKKMKSDTVSTVSPSISHEVMGPEAMIFIFWMLSFKSTFSLSYFTFIKRLFSSSLLSAIKVVSSAYLSLLVVIKSNNLHL